MEANPLIHVVGTVCKPGMESAVSKWYMETHIPMLLEFQKIKEVNLCQRFTDAPDYPLFLATYQFESPSAFKEYGLSQTLTAAKQDQARQWKEGEFELKWRVQFEVLRSWKR